MCWPWYKVIWPRWRSHHITNFALYVVVIDLSFFLHSKYMFIDNISFNNQLLYSNIKSLSYTQWVGKLHFINSIQASLREMNISVIFFLISERGTKTYFFYQFLLEILQQMYIAYSWMFFLSRYWVYTNYHGIENSEVRISETFQQ